eukprot:270897-Chlamydomonas_euryale.AAC.1
MSGRDATGCFPLPADDALVREAPDAARASRPDDDGRFAGSTAVSAAAAAMACTSSVRAPASWVRSATPRSCGAASAAMGAAWAGDMADAVGVACAAAPPRSLNTAGASPHSDGVPAPAFAAGPATVEDSGPTATGESAAPAVPTCCSALVSSPLSSPTPSLESDITSSATAVA